MKVMKVPFLDLRAQYEPLREPVLAAIARVCDSQRFILGPEVEALERELADMIGVGQAVAVSSGTDALLAAMMALDIGPGDEVVTSTYSFFATAGSIVRLGAKPVLVDIDPATFNVDAAAIAAALTPRTKAIIPVHLFGLTADMDPIMEVAAGRGIAVIEDAAQAIGARYKGRAAGQFGTLACFSFFPSKNLGAFGDGGLVTSNDPALAHRLRLLRNHGAEPKYFHKIIGGNFRLDALQAAVLRVKAPCLAAWTEGRRRNAARYRELMRAAGLDSHPSTSSARHARGGPSLSTASGCSEPVEGHVTLPVEPPDRYHIYNQFVVRVSRRDELRAHLQARGVETEIYYPVPFHLQPCFASLGHEPGEFPHAEAAARQTLALPIYAELTDDQLRHVVSAIAEFLGAAHA